jgi:hypothetical protein
MAENIKHTFVNYDLSHPRPTQAQRQTVSAFIGKHFRNRSAPARRAQPAPYLDDRRPLHLPLRLSTRPDSGQVFRQWRMRRLIKQGGCLPPQETGAGSEIPETSRPRSNNGNLLPRPVVECLVPGYPTEHRQKIFHTLDFRKSGLSRIAPLKDLPHKHVCLLLSLAALYSGRSLAE